ncbi:MAG: M48 family metalloprotease [Phycisphaerae bacterium]|nr:M48 family metalloprotease [Phycisphaerae bacterium]
MLMVVIAVLSIALARPEFGWVTQPVAVLALVLAATLVPPLVTRSVSRRALRLLNLHPAEPGHGQYALGRGLGLVRWLLGGLHAGVLALTSWPELCERIPVVGEWFVLPTLLAIGPFLISIVLVWVFAYPAERAVRHVAMEVYLFRGKPVQPVWTMVEFLTYKLRHDVLIILIPMAIILAAHDLISWKARAIRQLADIQILPDLLLGAVAVAVATITPEIIRHVWHTRRLPESPLRDRLVELGRRLGVRCREILVWESGGALVNAAVMGFVAPLRYVLITDTMLEQMSDQKVEAVFGHEAGHAKQHHIIYFMLFALISGCVLMVFSVPPTGFTRTQYQLLSVVLGALLLVKWGVVFGWISRRFERQADVYGVRTLALSGLPCLQSCALHGETAADATFDQLHMSASQASDSRGVASANPGLSPTSSAAPLCRTAAHVYGATLHDVALLNGIPPESSSWRHGSIASRARQVQVYASDSAALLRFERQVALVKLCIAVAAVIATGWAIVELDLWKLVTRWF